MSLFILFFPLFSGIFCGIFNRYLSQKFATIVASGSLIISALYAVKVLLYVHTEHKILHHTLATWFSIENFSVHWSIYVDELTAVMFVVVTLVSAIVHIYSYGYMHGDENLPRFMGYLSLFTFFMLALVCADNFVQLFFGWEGVGLCSYLLIGFWYKKDSASSAAVKAFVVNRVGDFAFIIGILAIIYFVGSVDFSVVFSSVKTIAASNMVIFGMKIPVIEFICIMLFIGCMGKSAQIGLHVWLPDAMEGPTPVSALIHAATMVTAGVFLVARASPLFQYAPIASQLILWVGGITCIFAASVAIAQNDIKKIIAYSTCSQLGYMFMACGAYAYNAAIFHLVTHAFFKAMLFLSAGIVIHACHEQDIRKMGGLRRHMPTTYMLFWIGSFAIMGIYPFAGYYSKDLILESVFIAGEFNMPFIFGLCAAFLTAIYSMKIIVCVFHGKSPNKHIDNEPAIMVLPLTLLAVGSILGGRYLEHYFSPDHLDIPLEIKYAPLAVGVAGMLCGFVIFQWKLAGKIAYIFSVFHRLLENKYFFDEIYERIFVKATRGLAWLSRLVDINVIDNIGPGGASATARVGARCISSLQSGYIFSYVFYVLLGLFGILSWWLYIYLI